MLWRALILVFLVILSQFSVVWACEDRWITAIHHCGESIVLDDDSVWLVETFDRYKVGSWQVGDHVDICGRFTQLKNLTRNAKVTVHAKDVINYEEKHASCDRR